MILQIKIRNMFSFRDETILDLQAIPLKSKKSRMLDRHIIKSGKERMLKAVAIYGANASGKSNLLKSIEACVNLIRESHNNNELSHLGFTPYKLGDIDKPSEFMIRFLIDGQEYEYGFTAAQDRIATEYLYTYPSGRKSLVFSRDESKGPNKKDIYKFRYQISRPLDIASNTSTKTLFLSRGSQMDRDILKKVYTFFTDQIAIGLPTVAPSALATIDTDKKSQLLSSLRAADSDITDFYVSDNRIYTTHVGHPEVPFDLLTEESLGTIKLFNLSLALIDAIAKGKALFIDEIESSIHNSLVDILLASFYNGDEAQIIFTTHNTSMLSLEKLRKDQIYFTNKQPGGASELYSLADFKDFDERAPLEKAYSQGMFDAIPIVYEPLVTYNHNS